MIVFFNNLSPIRKVILLLILVILFIITGFIFISYIIPRNNDNPINIIINSFNSNLNQLGVTVPNENVSIIEEKLIEGEIVDINSDIGYLTQFYVKTIDDKWLLDIPASSYSDEEFDQYINQLPEFLFDDTERGGKHLYFFEPETKRFEYLDFDTIFFDKIDSENGETFVKLKFDQLIIENNDNEISINGGDFKNTLPIIAKKIPNSNNEYFVLGMNIDGNENTKFNLAKVKLSDFNGQRNSIQINNYDISDFFINELRLEGVGEAISGIVNNPNSDLQNQFIETIIPQLEMEVISSNRIFFKSQYFDFNYRVFDFEIESELLKFTRTYSFGLSGEYNINCFENECIIYSIDNNLQTKRAVFYTLDKDLDFRKYEVLNLAISTPPYQSLMLNGKLILHFDTTVMSFENI
jgi:hypothetical protein